MKIDTAQLFNVTGIAEKVGVPRTNVNAWTRSLSFPQPLDTPGLGGVRVYDWAQVEAYVAERPHLTADLDTSSSASRQHWIDTGVYLKKGEADA